MNKITLLVRILANDWAAERAIIATLTLKKSGNMYVLSSKSSTSCQSRVLITDEATSRV